MTTQPTGTHGLVSLVGAGPGDPEAVTLRGIARLRQADVVLYDYLVNPALLEHVPADAERICLGHHRTGRTMTQQQVNQRMVDEAMAGRNVVRLKSGDPTIFGRLVEEVGALDEAGVEVEVVPGVTAGIAALSDVVGSMAGFPASPVTLITGHERPGKGGPPLDYARLARLPGTLVFYMGVTTAPVWSRSLIEHGRAADTPVVVVRRVSWPDQTRIATTLAELPVALQASRIRPPVVVLVGEPA